MKKWSDRFLMRTAKNEEGFLLVAALTLMTVLVLVGGTAVLLSSTDLKIAANFRTNESVLQAAMAGAERAREILRGLNKASSTKDSFSDELVQYIGANGALNGFASGTDDPPIASGTLNGVSYTVYLTNDVQDSGGQYSITDSNKRALLTSVATTSSGAKARVETIVKIFPMVSSPATIYTKGDLTGNGSSLTISGVDQCGQASNLGAVYAKGDYNPSGGPSITGAITEEGTLDLNIQEMINMLKGAADITLTEDHNAGDGSVTYGSATNNKIVYSNTSSPLNVNGLMLNNITGHGILLVDGDLELGGNFNWSGMILATGAVKLNGGGGINSLNIAGQLLSGTSIVTDVSINGSNNIQYNSCNVRNAIASAPVRVASWKQAF